MACLSSLLTGCISLLSENVGTDYNHATASETALKTPAISDVEVTTENNTPAQQGAQYKLGFNVNDTQYYANKSLVISLGGAALNAEQKVIAKGTSLVKNSNGKWDRIQDHATTVTTKISAGVSLGAALDDPDNLKPEDFHVNDASFSFKGNLAEPITGYTFSNLENSLSDQTFDIDALKNLIPEADNVVANIGDIKDIFDPNIAYEADFYGVYGNNKTQYSAFYASSTDLATTEELAAISGNVAYSVNFRGMANNAGTESKLDGTGTSNVNFSTGSYSTDIAVTTGGATYGAINISGTSVANSYYVETTATFTPQGGTAIAGYGEFSTFGSQGDTILGTTDFADDDFALIGAFAGTKSN